MNIIVVVFGAAVAVIALSTVMILAQDNELLKKSPNSIYVILDWDVKSGTFDDSPDGICGTGCGASMPSDTSG